MSAAVPQGVEILMSEKELDQRITELRAQGEVTEELRRLVEEQASRNPVFYGRWGQMNVK